MLNRDQLTWLFKTELWSFNNYVVWLLHLNKGFPVPCYYYHFAFGNCLSFGAALSLTTAWGSKSFLLDFPSIPRPVSLPGSEVPWAPTVCSELRKWAKMAYGHEGGWLWGQEWAHGCRPATCQQRLGNVSQWQRGLAGKLREHSWAQKVTEVLWILLEEKNLCVRQTVRRESIEVLIQEDVSDTIMLMLWFMVFCMSIACFKWFANWTQEFRNLYTVTWNRHDIQTRD